MFIVNERVQGVTKDLVSLYQTVCTSTVGHMTDFGFITDLQPLFRPIRFVGNAVTVRIPYLDSTAVHKSLDLVRPGDVLVIETSGDDKRACFGEIVAHAAKVKNIAGVVLSGRVTDYLALVEMRLPVYSSGVSPLTTRILGLEGQINVPISVGGVTVKPGDLVLADDDGVLVLDPAVAKGFGEQAIIKQDGEPEKKRQLDAGLSLADLGKAGSFFASK
jgi:regulator of RNase E activity RraA